MRLGRLLQLWRRREALTLRAAAGRIGIHASTLARIERGESMHGATLTTVLVWLMGREERSLNEELAFEAEDAVALKESGETEGIHKDCGENDVILKSFHDVAERNTAPAGELESIPYKFGGEEAGAVESSRNTCELGGRASGARGGPEDVTGGRVWTGSFAEESEGPGAAIEDQPEAAAELPVYALD